MNTAPTLSSPAKPEELLAYLDFLGFQTTTHEHEPVFTVEESEHVTARIAGGHTKNLFVKDKKGNFFLIVAGNKARISLNKVHGLIGAQGRVSFANADLLMEHLGVPATCRASFGLYNTKAEVDVLVDALELCHEFFA